MHQFYRKISLCVNEFWYVIDEVPQLTHITLTPSGIRQTQVESVDGNGSL